MLEEAAKALINNGLGGVVAMLMFLLLKDERKDHKETRQKLDVIVQQQGELTEKAIETMTRVATLVSERLPNKNRE